MKLTIPALQPGTAYKIQVRTDDGEAVSDWSPEFTFTTDIDSRSPGVPANRTWVVSGDSFVGRWDAVTQYTNGEVAYISAYEVELNAGATTKIISVPNKTDGTQVEYVLSYEQNRALFASPQATVNFRVRAVDNKGLRGAWSAQIPASNPAPAAPTNAVVTNVVDGIDLKWTAPSDADLIGYNVYVGTTAGFTPSAGNRVFSGSATQFHYASTTYSLQYFKIRAVDKFNQESTDLTAQGTPINPFTVDTTAPNTPTGLAASIVNNASGVGAVATVTWTMTSPPTDLAGFNIRWRKTGSTDWSVTTTDSDSRAAIVELGSAYQDYDFQIRAFDFSANESAWSATALGDSPANSAPAQVTGVSITPGKDNIRIAWTANTEADLDDYEVQVATNNTFSAGLLTYRVGATTLAVNGLSTNTTYYVRVRAKDTGGLYGSYSATANATTTDFPVTDLSDGEVPATPGAATLVSGIGYVYASWNPVTLNAVGGAQSDPVTYEVHRATSAGGTYTKVFETSSTFAVLEDLVYGTTYYVKLIAKDRDGSSALGVASNGAAPGKATVTDISATSRDLGGNITTSSATEPSSPITGDIWIDTTTGFEKRWSGSAWVTTGVATTLYTQAKGTDLVVNGTGYMKNNFNFSSWTFSNSDAPPGASGSFVSPAGAQTKFNDELIPIDTGKKYTLSLWARQLTNGVTAYAYTGLVPYDAFGNVITPQHYMYRVGTTTALAAPLNPGDTTVSLTSSTYWNNAAGSASHFRNIIIWDYTDPGGKTWAPETYSRHYLPDAYADGGINTTTHIITLRAPYAGTAVPAGTMVSNGSSGGNYMYSAMANTVIPAAWTKFKSATPFTGVLVQPGPAGANPVEANPVNGFPQGTAAVKLLFLTNRSLASPWNEPTSVMAVAGLSLSDATAAQITADAAIKTYVTEYAVNSSETVAPTSGWSTSQPTRTPGTFIWIRTTVTRNDGTTSTTSPALLTGNTGSQGIQGPAGADGTSLYTWLKYADTPTTGMSDDPTGKTYIGLAYNKTSATESSNYADYQWSLIQGPQGDQGIQGPAGADGTTTYTWVKYADDATGTGMSDSPTGKIYIGLAFNKTTATESTNPADYSWSLIQGPQGPAGSDGAAGADGADGVSVTSITPYFQTTATGAAAPAKPTLNPPGGSWTTTEPAYAANTELWRTDRILFSNSTFAYTDVTKVSAYTAATQAMTTANGKNTIYHSTGTPGTTANVAGDTWIQYNGSNQIIAQWRGTGGTSWVAETVGSAFIANLDAGKITAGSTFTQNLLVKSTFTLGDAGTPGIIKSYDYVAGSAGFALSSAGLEIRDGVVTADTLISGSGVVNNLIINSGGAIQSSNYVANTTGFKIDNSGINIGSNGYVNAGSLKAGTITGTTINVGAGGVLNVDSTAKVKSNNYVAGSTGWQLDSAGLEINDGAVKADALVSGTIDAATLTLSGANGKIVGTGFELSGSGLTVTNGTIEAAAVKIQAGENLLPTWFTDFEATASFFTPRVTNVSGNFLWDVNGAPVFGDYSFGFVWGTVSANPVLYFGSSVTDYNIPVEEGEEYIFSAYMWCRGTVATNAQLKVKWSTGAITTLVNENLPANMPDTGQPRYSAVATAPAGATGAVLFVESNTWTNLAGFNVDGMQVERKSGSLNTPSQWRPGGLTAINGGLIRTGEIRSTANSQTWDGTQYIEDANRPAWSIDPEGDASFNRMNVRGRLVVGDLTAAAAEGGDPYGYLYTAASANYVQGSQGWLIRGDGYAEFRDLAADSIHGEAIRAGTLTADKIATGLLDAQVAIVGDVYAEGNSGERVGINKDGFYVYGPKPDVTLPDMGPLYVSFPTDGTKPNIITGELQANTLLATGGISVRGSSEFSAGSEIKMFNNVSESKSAPSLSVDWETTQLYGTEWDTEMSSTVNMWWRSDITPNLTGDAYFDEGTHGWESNTLFETHAPAAIQYNATENYVELQFPTAAKPSNFGTWVKTVPGQSYTITASVWVYTGNQAVKLAVAYGATGAANTVFDGWTNITLNFTATSNEHYIMVQTDGNATGGNAFVDHVLLPQHQAGAWEVAFRTPIDEVTEEMHFRIFTKNGRWAGRPPSGEGWNSVNYANGYYVSAARWIDSTGQQYKARIYRYNPTGAYTIVSWKDTATGSLYSVSYTKIAGQSDIEEPRLGVVGRSVADGGTGQELVVWERNVASKRYQGSVRNTNLTHKRYIYLPDDTTAVSHGVVGGVVHHPGDFGSDRFIVLSEYSAGTDLYAYTGSGGSGTTNFTGTRSRNEDFPRPLTTTTAVAWKPDAAAPGGTGYYYTVNNRGKLYKHEGGGNKWTTETNKWWVGFTWYDNVADRTLTVNMTSGSATITATTGTFSANDVGRGIIANSTVLPAGATIATYVNSTTVTASVAATGSVTGTTLYVGNHETKISARAYIMMTKRARLNITVPSFPPDNGTTDTVNKARIYMARSSAATAPSLASDYNYNTEIATVSGTVSNATFASARKPPVNGNFPGGNPATIISSTGNSFWKANDEAQFQNLVLVGTDDASTAAGNKPALRIGTTTGSHLRIDGDEIIKMNNDTTQGTLYLNDGGTTISSRMIITSTTDVNASAGNAPPLRIGDIAGSHLRIDGNEIMSMANDTTQGNIGLNGCFFSKFDYGTTTQSTGTTGYINVAHNMGKKADYAQAVQASFYGQNWSFKWDNGGSTSTYNRFLVLEGSSAGSSSPVSVDSTNMTFAWFCIAA